MKCKIFIVLFFFIQKLHSQNLVLNPSFEDTISCISWPGWPQMQCSYWIWGNGGSPDYFNLSYCGGANVPNNQFGYQFARTGAAYCGLALYLTPMVQPNGREYLGGQLNDTLKQGHTYCLSFYVVKADSSWYYTSNIGMYLSQNSSVDYSTTSNLPYIPQIVNTNGIIYDTLNWTQISGNYVAGGGENILSLVILIMMQIQLLTPIIKQIYFMPAHIITLTMFRW